jgi:hypothetical protein
MAKRIPVALDRSIKRHGRIMNQVIKSVGKKRKLILQHAPKTFFTLIQSIFRNILKGKIAAPLNVNKSLLNKVIRTKDPSKVVVQNGSGIVSILAHVVPSLIALVPEFVKLFKKKK